MSGSWHAATTRRGALRLGNDTLIETLSDAGETIEDMHGMIWWLATRVALLSGPPVPKRAAVLAVIRQAEEGALQERLRARERG